MASNPATGLVARQDKKLPHFVQREDMLRLLTTPRPDTPFGLRDRALLDTLGRFTRQ